MGSACVLAVVTLLGYPTPPLALAPAAAVIAAASLRRPLPAALVALAGTAAGSLAAALLRGGGPLTAATDDWSRATLLLVLAAAVLGALASMALRAAPSLGRVLALVALVAIVLPSPYTLEFLRTPTPEGVTPVRWLATRPVVTHDAQDTTLLLAHIHRLHSGERYYASFHSILSEANAKRSVHIDETSPTAYRLPTLYWLLARLPADGWSLMLAFFACGALAGASAYMLVRQVAARPIALVAAAAVSTFFAGVSQSADVVFSEPWAGALALSGIALFVTSRHREDAGRTVLTVCACAALLLAALVRELASPLLVLGLLAVTVSAEDRRRRLWIPWTAALAVFTAAYAAHAAAVSRVASAAARIAGANPFPWLHPDGSGLVGGIVLLSWYLAVPAAAAWVLAALGAWGAGAWKGDLSARLMVVGSVLGGLAPLLVFHPPGTGTMGSVPGYWIDLVLPVLLAVAAVGLATILRAGLTLIPSASLSASGPSERKPGAARDRHAVTRRGRTRLSRR